MLRLIAIIVAATLVLTTGGVGRAQAPARVRPNIVIVMFDDLSPRLGAYGDRLARTPALDAFAREGIVYTNAFVTSPVCAPSRSAIMTGVHQQTLGTMHMRTRGAAGLKGGGPIEYDAVPPSEVKAFPELLRRLGYWTVNVGKTDFQFGVPFTMWDVNAPDADWRKRPRDQPLFAFINLHHTHESYLWPEDTSSDNPLVKQVAARNKRAFAAKLRLTDPAAVTVPPYLPDTPVVRADLARLYDNLAFDDANFGRLMQALEADGLDDGNTVVIVAADHGDGLPRVKRAIYASGLRVPLMIRLPGGVGRGERRDDLVSFVDLAPTILALAGAETPRFVQGRALLVRGSEPAAEHVFAAADRFDTVTDRRKTAIDGRYQYVRSFLTEPPFFRPLPFRDALPTMQELWRLNRSGGLTAVQAGYFTSDRPREELYDLAADPHTVRDLARDPRRAGDVARLRAAMDGWLRRTGDLTSRPEIDVVRDMWPGLAQPQTAAPTASQHGGRIALSSATPGASIGYSLEGPGAEHWSLYASPLAVAPGQRLWAKAIRYGHAESAVTPVPADIPRSTR